MNEYIAIQDIQPIIERKRVLPTVTMWNRQEGRPRTKNFDRALKAEVRDALFMLTKQWQMGEFRGDDAGSPVFAKVNLETTKLTKYQADDHPVQPFEEDVPLETKVEQRRLHFKADDQIMSLDIRLLMGRQWLKMLSSAGLPGLRDAFVTAYDFKPVDPNSRDDALVCAHRTTWQSFTAVTGRSMDGGELYLYLKDKPENRAWDRLEEEPLASDKTTIDQVAERFVTWFEKLFYQPVDEDKDAWLPSKLEYQFACSAPKKDSEKVLAAEEYYHGHLDWYNFNVDVSKETLGDTDAPPPDEPPEGALTYSFFPVPIQFDGMPNTRWWTFEEGKTNFGDIKPDTTDLNKLLLIEFGLVYANDWFVVPFTLPAGVVANVRGLAVTNVFGERTWVPPSGQGSDEDWQRWNMFTLNTTGTESIAADLSLLMLPSNPKIQEGPPIEVVNLIRDEMANMVWGIESRIPLPGGGSRPGREAAFELRKHFKRIIEDEGGTEEKITYNASIRYQLMTSVPENWIPFIPVHIEGQSREIQLQRASMPRLIEGDTEPIEKVKPRTQLLRTGLEQSQPYFLFEEEVPRAGIRVSQSYQRTRWYNGQVFNWLGVRKQVGRGEKSSGLAFDQVVPSDKNG